MSFMKIFAILIMMSGAVSSGQNPPSTPREVFAFWYEDWKPNVTVKKLHAASVVIGVVPLAIPEIHNTGKRALQYVTYYQSVFDRPFLKDKADLPNVGFQDIEGFEKSAFGGDNNYVLCPNSVELKSRVLRYVDETVRQGYDGYFIDNTFLDPAAHEVCTAKHQHIKPNTIGWMAYLDLVKAVRDRLKQEKPKALLMINAGNPSSIDRMPSGKASLWDISDYVLWESYGYSSYRGPRHDRWKSTIDASFTFAAQPARAAKMVALSYPENVAEARFSFAVARIFGFQWTANLGDRDQNGEKEGGHFGAFVNEIPFSLGEPLTGLPGQNNPLLHRVFQNGEAFANTGPIAQKISISKGSAIYMSDQPMRTGTETELVLAPMMAVIVIKKP